MTSAHVLSRLTRENGPVAKRPRRFRTTTGSKHALSPEQHWHRYVSRR
jgi:hypothetical protein